tara:strand:- start:20624 stop:21133 length:510 start_codon:yes stop_codon:yes gene_type:complete
MEYTLNATGEVKTVKEIKKLYPHIALPKIWNASILELLDISEVTPEPVPEPTTDEKIVSKRADLLGQLYWKFKEVAARPSLKTSLGFTIQAGYEDLADLNIGLERRLTFVRDIDNINQPVTAEQFALVIYELKSNGLRIKQNKWTIEEAIKEPNATLKILEEIDINSGW